MLIRAPPSPSQPRIDQHSPSQMGSGFMPVQYYPQQGSMYPPPPPPVLQEATGSVLNANGKRSRPRNGKSTAQTSAHGAPKRRKRGGAPPAIPVLDTRSLAPPPATAVGPSIQNMSAPLRVPEPLRHFESVSKRLHGTGDSSQAASDVWWHCYYLKDRKEPAERPDNQHRRKTNPEKDGYTAVGCRLCR